MKCYNPRLAFRNKNGGKIVFTPLTWSQFIHKPDGYYIPKLEGQIRGDALLDAPLCIPCGKCDACHLTRAKDTATRCMHEFRSRNSQGIFLTLTYDDASLPPDGSYDPDHLISFLKKLRDKIGYGRISTLGCAEYGERTGRAHFHLLIFGWEPIDPELVRMSQSTHAGDNYKIHKSKTLTNLWTKGIHEYGTITEQSCAYVARYTLKKAKDRKNEKENRLPARTLCRSLRPALGKSYFESYYSDFYSIDSIIMRGPDGTSSRRSIPRYYDRLFEKRDPASFQNIQNNRKEAQSKQDQYEMTKARLKTRKFLHQETIKKLKGNL